MTPGSKGSDHPAVSVVRLPHMPKHSRLPFTGSELSLQLLSTGQSVNTASLFLVHIHDQQSRFVDLSGFQEGKHKKLCQSK